MKKKKNGTITSRLLLYDFKVIKRKERKKEKKEMGMIRIDFATK